MRLYQRTSTAEAEGILQNGFADTAGPPPAPAGLVGVWLSDAPPGAGEGPAGDAVLAVDLPDDVARAYRRPGGPGGAFVVPAEVVNRHGPARLHDHEWAGFSREELVSAAERWERYAADHPAKAASVRDQAAAIRRAIELFDRHGYVEKPESD